MQLIEAALAFAITMLVLSLVVSSFVEIIHRIFSMRETGLKYMLGQIFDQVLAKYVVPAGALARINNAQIPQVARDEAAKLVKDMRTGFVERMSANRAPMGVAPKATPTDPAEQVAKNPKRAFGLWSGRDLASMTPAEFMERLGSIDIGAAIKQANTAASDAAKAAGAAAEDVVDPVLKDIAQKFEAFGKESGEYFEGRARLLSVVVAIALAFAAHVDAVDLFKTYLRDPNARAKAIEQSQAVTAQYKASQEAVDALKKLAPDAAAPSPDEVKKQVEALQKDSLAAIADANATVKQYADLGVPLGWTDARIAAADMSQWVWTCKDPKTGKSQGFGKLWRKCTPDEAGYKGPKNTQYRDVWFQVPTVLSVWFYLFLGGLLIGLGSPFWYDAVTGLTNIRGVARGLTGGAPPQPAAAGVAVAAVAPEAHKAQPVTPVGAFQVSNIARKP
jgi:hypothetical protein